MERESGDSRSILLLLLKIEGGAVHAVALASWFWAIGEDVPQVRITFCAADFRTLHAVASVDMFCYVFRVRGIVKAWPARSGIVLGLRGEERCPTAYAKVCTLPFIIPIWVVERWLGAMFTCYMVLKRA